MDIRLGLPSLGLRVQQLLGWDPYVGNGVSLYTKLIEHWHFPWPTAKDEVIHLSSSYVSRPLEGVDCRNPRKTWRSALRHGLL